MPTISLSGISVDVSSEAAAVAARWNSALHEAAQVLVGSAANFDQRVQPSVDPSRLGPLMVGLITLLQEATSLVPMTGVNATAENPEVQSTVQDLISRYLTGFVIALDRLLRDWDQLGPIFFAQDAGTGRPCGLIELNSAEPLPGALTQGGVPSLVLHLTIGVPGGSPSRLDAALVYLPRDVEADFALIGNTSGICSAGPDYLPHTHACNHLGCRSIAERISALLGDPQALPTCIVWPASPASRVDQPAPAGCYGYREFLSTGQSTDNTVSSPQAPEIAAFYRTLGRQLAFAYGCGAQDLDTDDFAIHRGRPYWLGVESAFAAPSEDLRQTGMFDVPDGPLAPSSHTTPAAPFGLRVTVPGSAAPPSAVSAANFVSEVRCGCGEVLGALGALAPELGNRLQTHRNLLTHYVPREPDQYRSRQARWLEILSITRTWSDRHLLVQEAARWRDEDDLAWARIWFGGLLTQIQATSPLWPGLPAEALDFFNPLRDQIIGVLRVRSLQDVRVDTILALLPAERQPIWDALIAIARLLAGYFRQIDWMPHLETAWQPLPDSALVEFEVADHANARFPYFVRRLQCASLWSAGSGGEVKLSEFADAAPPCLARDTFFPEPACVGIARELHLLANPGVQAKLCASIPQLMLGQVRPAAGPAPVGPELVQFPT